MVATANSACAGGKGCRPLWSAPAEPCKPWKTGSCVGPGQCRVAPGSPRFDNGQPLCDCLTSGPRPGLIWNRTGVSSVDSGQASRCCLRRAAESTIVQGDSSCSLLVLSEDYLFPYSSCLRGRSWRHRRVAGGGIPQRMAGGSASRCRGARSSSRAIFTLPMALRHGSVRAGQ